MAPLYSMQSGQLITSAQLLGEQEEVDADAMAAAARDLDTKLRLMDARRKAVN